MKTNSKSKGSGFERQVSKEISLLLTNNERDDILYRTQNSGGRYTVRKKLKKDTINQDGDIAPTCSGIGELFLNHYMIECKFYKNVDLYNLITYRKDTINVFWEQSLNQVSDTGKIPLLIMKSNFKPILMITNQKGRDIFIQYLNMDYIIKARNSLSDMYIYNYKEQFLSNDSVSLEYMLNNLQME